MREEGATILCGLEAFINLFLYNVHVLPFRLVTLSQSLSLIMFIVWFMILTGIFSGRFLKIKRSLWPSFCFLLFTSCLLFLCTSQIAQVKTFLNLTFIHMDQQVFQWKSKTKEYLNLPIYFYIVEFAPTHNQVIAHCIKYLVLSILIFVL